MKTLSGVIIEDMEQPLLNTASQKITAFIPETPFYLLYLYLVSKAIFFYFSSKNLP
jgi:hypothetical protein